MKIFLIISLLAVVVSSQGISKPKQPVLSPRITNGMLARWGQFKYQVGLDIREGNKTFICSGTLIAPNWILTTALCVKGANAIYAAFGSTSDLSGSIVTVVQGVLHGRYNNRTYANDIGLLRIPSIESKFGPNIAPVALPPLNSDNSYVNENAIASGWGRTSDQDSSSAKELQYARFQIVPDSVCLKFYGSTYLKDNHICVQGPRGTSACKGDGGSPLVTESSGVLVGMLSYISKAGCTQGHPVGYTRISSYRSWIKHVTGV